MTTSFPKVTVICNTYNAAHLLPRAFDSILAQVETFADFEVIVVDDASTDSTAEVIQAYASKFEALSIRFLALRMAENSGYQACPKNRGIELAKGDFIRFLDADNEMVPGSMKVLWDAAMEGDIWPDIVYGRRRYVADEGFKPPEQFGDVKWEGDSPLVEHDPDRLAASPSFNYIDTGDALIARGVFWWLIEHTSMMWNEGWRRFGDWELFTRMANLDKLVGAATPRFKAVDSIVSIYHWTGQNLQLTRPYHESPVAKSAISGDIL